MHKVWEFLLLAIVIIAVIDVVVATIRPYMHVIIIALAVTLLLAAAYIILRFLYRRGGSW